MDEDTRFWIVNDVNDRDGNGPADWVRSGELVGIVDEVEGGIIAYCHELSAERLIKALRTAAAVQ